MRTILVVIAVIAALVIWFKLKHQPDPIEKLTPEQKKALKPVKFTAPVVPGLPWIPDFAYNWIMHRHIGN